MDLATAVGDSPAAYEVTADDATILLDLARVAAHDSGARTTAPLACYVLGLARGRHPDQSVDDLVGAIVPPDAR